MISRTHKISAQRIYFILMNDINVWTCDTSNLQGFSQRRQGWQGKMLMIGRTMCLGRTMRVGRTMQSRRTVFLGRRMIRMCQNPVWCSLGLPMVSNALLELQILGRRIPLRRPFLRTEVLCVLQNGYPLVRIHPVASGTLGHWDKGQRHLIIP